MLTTIAIVGGTGPEGRGLATRWARAGLKVIIGSRDENRARTTAKEVRERLGGDAAVEGMENSAAVGASSVVVLAVPFEGQASILKQLHNHFQPGAVLVCATVPLASGVGDKASRV